VVTAGYWGRPEVTAETFAAGTRWLRRLSRTAAPAGSWTS
jgi:hypothetical protein